MKRAGAVRDPGPLDHCRVSLLPITLLEEVVAVRGGCGAIHLVAIAWDVRSSLSTDHAGTGGARGRKGTAILRRAILPGGNVRFAVVVGIREGKRGHRANHHHRRHHQRYRQHQK
jgi:hypothetical protein